MDIAISCLARNNQVKINDIFSEGKSLKHMMNELVISKSLVYSWNFCIKSNRYLNDLLVNNHVIHGLFSDGNNPLIPEDIFRLEILTRLPVKTLMRFQCVCKSWHSLISSDPVFKEFHLARTSVDPNNHGQLVVWCRSGVGRNKSEHSSPVLAPDMRLVGSFNGLVCLYRYDYPSRSVPCIVIWNPATHQYTYVPPPSTAPNMGATNISFAFGFDSIKNDYKVIYVTKMDARPMVADVYSCNAGSWGNINVCSSFILKKACSFSRGAINVNESVYWRYRCDDGSIDRKSYVISFDIRHEVFRLFPGLDFLGNQYSTLVNMRNSLASIVHDGTSTTYVSVYVLNQTMSSCDGGSSWSKMYTVGPITLTRRMIIFQCFPNGDLLFKDEKQFKLVRIDPKTYAIIGSSIDPFVTSHLNLNLNLNLSRAYGFGYTETLVSVMGMKHINTNECDSILFIEQNVKISLFRRLFRTTHYIHCV